MSELFLRLLAASCSGLVLALIIFAVKSILKNKMSKAWQYYIWLIVIARLLVPYNPVITAPAPVYNTEKPATIQEGEIVAHNSTVGSEPIALSEQVQEEKAITDFRSGELSDDLKSLSSGIWKSLNNDIWKITKKDIWIAWLMIAIGLLLYRIVNYNRYTQEIKCNGRIVTEPELQAAFRIASDVVGVKRVLPIYLSDRVESPMLAGMLRPFIVLPSSEFTNTEVHNILIHELTHYKRRDIIYKWMMQITACIHWFNPLVYLIVKDINRSCELSCDEAILKKLDTEGKRQYGNTLLASVMVGRKHTGTGISLALNEDAKLLKERLGSIMKYKKNTRIMKALSVTLTLIMLCSSILIGAYIIPASSVSANSAKTEVPQKTHPDNGQFTAIDSNKVTVINLTIDTASVNIITTDQDTFRLSYTGGADKSYHASVELSGDKKQIAMMTITGKSQKIDSMSELTEPDSITLEIPNKTYQSIDIKEKNGILNLCELDAAVNASDTKGILSLEQTRLKRGNYSLSTKKGMIDVDLTSLHTGVKLDNTDGMVNINFKEEPGADKLLLGITGDQDSVTIPDGWKKFCTKKDLTKQENRSKNKAYLVINNNNGFTEVQVASDQKKTNNKKSAVITVDLEKANNKKTAASNGNKEKAIKMKTAKINDDIYYLVETEEELRAIGSKAYPLSGNYMLNKDITLTKKWKAIGDEETPFTGKFDGNGCSISNLTTTDKKAEYIGLFGYAEGAYIHNVHLTKVNIDSAGGKGRHIGPIIAIALDCNVEDCQVE